jgi:ABC-2 type transport system ATP-binding protein
MNYPKYFRSEIVLKNVFKTYNPGLFRKKVQAVFDLSLEVRKGEVFGLIGPNGAGKSTTIRLILGLIRPDKGLVQYRGQSFTTPGITSEIGYLPEAPYLYDHLTLDELLAFGARTSGLASYVKSRRCAELMKKLGIIDARKRPLRTFSKGMLQRAGICFALLHDPQVVILDEPMSGLDPVGRKMVFELVADLKEKGKTIFFCSHILNDVERLCDQIGIMNKGRLLEIVYSETFVQNEGEMLHLVVKRLCQNQRHLLEPLVTAITDEVENSVLSFPLPNLAKIVDKLQNMNINVLAVHNERLSLEDYFMRTIEADK